MEKEIKNIPVCDTFIKEAFTINKTVLSELNVKAVFEHIQKCDVCKTNVVKYYDSLDLPLIVKIIINNFMEKK